MGYSGKPYEDTGGKRAKSPNQRRGMGQSCWRRAGEEQKDRGDTVR